jgi:hypothetical protein
MDRELARKRAAEVIRAEPRAVSHTAVGKIVIRDGNRTVVTSRASQLYAAGRIEREYRLGRDGQGWVAVVVARAPRSWLRRNGLRLSLAAGGTVAFLAGLAWAVRALVLALAAALPIVAGFLGIVVLGCLAAALTSGGSVIEVVQKVKVRR